MPSLRAEVLIVVALLALAVMAIPTRTPAQPVETPTVDVDGTIAAMRAEIEQHCHSKGWTLRVMSILFDADERPINAVYGCGDPKRSKT
jgi:hypothetical protein